MTQTEETGVAWTAEAAWVEVDHLGKVRAINTRFTDEFGWQRESIVGHPVQRLVPEGFRDAHNLGFSRFAEFGRPCIAGQPVMLPVMTASGETVMTETCIQAERGPGGWRFGAQLARIEPGAEER